MILPSSSQKLSAWATKIIDDCRASQGQRAALARSLRVWLYTGSPDGDGAIMNRLHTHNKRKASYLYSPSDLRFHIDFAHEYPKDVLSQAEIAAKVLTRAFERKDVDLQYGDGVFEALTYGCCIPKAMWQHDGLASKLVMPWQLGVYREDKEDFRDQEAVVETNYITAFELWRRISHLPNSVELFKRARAYAKKNSSDEQADSYFHQVVIAGTPPVVQTQSPFTQQPGGMVDVNSYPSGAIMAAAVAEELITLHELWVWDDEQEDYTTIQIAEPDILIAPQYKRKNMFVDDHLPYGMIRPNGMSGNFWGRTELADLMKLQHLLRDRLEDIKKLMGVQYDKFFAFIGGSGMQDENYDAAREAGFVNLEQGADMKDMTPQLPKEWAEDIKMIIEFMNEISGFQNILSGQGEPGVRAGNHAQTLMKTAAPQLKDQALLVERQCADFADKAFQLIAAKEAKAYWTTDGKEFLLSQIPDDYRITVDSHSSSPIYEQDHQQMAAFLAKLGVIDGESLLDLLPVPMRDILKAKYREIAASKAQEQKEIMQTLPPEQAFRVLQGGKKR